MKNMNLVRWLFCGLLLVVCYAPLDAQTNVPSDNQLPPSSETQNQSQPVSLERPADQIPPVPLYATEPPSTGRMLGGGIMVTNPTALIEAQGVGGPATSPMAQYRYLFLYGMSSSVAYRDAMPGVLNDKSDVALLLNPYVGLVGRTRTGSYLLNYTVDAMPHDTAQSPPAVFHQVSATMNGFITKNVDWSVTGIGGYGSEASRILGPLSYQVVTNFPTADTSNAILAGLNDTVLTGSLDGTLGWQKSPRDRFAFELTSAYTSYTPGTTGLSIPGANHAVSEGGTIRYDRAVSPRTSLAAFGDLFHVSSMGSCSTYGGGLGITHEASHRVSMGLQGGPQFSTKGCGGPQSAMFTGNLLVRATARTRVYLVGGRTFTTVYRLHSSWDDNISAGVERDSRLFVFNFDAMYVRGGLQPSYEGLLVGPSVRYRMWRTLSWLVGYRRFHGSSWDLHSGSMNFGTVTMLWEPRPIGFPR